MDQSIEQWYNKLQIKSSSTEYKILKHLCTSGNGELFLAITSENFLVCIKILVNKLYVETEVENIKNVNKRFPEICLPYIDYFIIHCEKDRYYILVMKYFEGYISLDEYLCKNLFHVEQKQFLKKEITKHIENIHKLNLCHNEIDWNKIIIHSKTSSQIRFLDLGFCLQRLQIQDEDFVRAKQKDLLSIQSM